MWHIKIDRILNVYQTAYVILICDDHLDEVKGHSNHFLWFHLLFTFIVTIYLLHVAYFYEYVFYVLFAYM